MASSGSCSPSVRDGAARSPYRVVAGRGYDASWLNTTSGGRYARDDAAVFRTMEDAR
ncbi:hypothetical protein LINGRAHAP2_LOCUS23713 [Linum grandiflorum]